MPIACETFAVCVSWWHVIWKTGLAWARNWINGDGSAGFWFVCERFPSRSVSCRMGRSDILWRRIQNMWSSCYWTKLHVLSSGFSAANRLWSPIVVKVMDKSHCNLCLGHDVWLYQVLNHTVKYVEAKTSCIAKWPSHGQDKAVFSVFLFVIILQFWSLLTRLLFYHPVEHNTAPVSQRGIYSKYCTFEMRQAHHW